uniref:Uncharacterized protein n=1 Tax=Setaria italica TaxID=4555 RepID=K4ANE9_SETIT
MSNFFIFNSSPNESFILSPEKSIIEIFGALHSTVCNL